MEKNNLLARVEVLVIGGGVVGCAVARQMVMDGAKVALVEKSSDILAGASKGNSAILHTGFDAPTGTLEQECVQSGYAQYLKIRESLNLPIEKVGANVVAWNSEQEEKLVNVLEKGLNNGVSDIKLLSKKEVGQAEPHLAHHLKAAVSVPGEYIVDPWSSPYAYLLQSVENGGEVFCNAEVLSGEFDGEKWLIKTAAGDISCRYVINSAGLYGDIVNQRVLKDCDFVIRPRKGQFIVFDKSARELLNGIILPVPTERTKGIVLFPTIFGNIVVGPTAEEQDSRTDAGVVEETLRQLQAQAVEMLPELAQTQITATFAGIRPATEKKHYRVSQNKDKNWITLGGIRSTGLTSALGLGLHVSKLFAKLDANFKKLDNPLSAKAPMLAEKFPRDFNSKGYEEMVCHCELVTKREIVNALNSKIPAKSLSGLKRRTRATMGRCQGFYCSAKLSKLTEGKFNNSLSVDDERGVVND
ncbi:MAG: NAD(P)/FAD-dependent oxidoreductase [Bdellovibrionales bacterium]|jgi:glycerol-3-phosphate dehydrogenase|nr:NAD(P)/FAD-dependent oxidoreductase [Bdellovibrionales bacterium]MBT3527165.1 NAD(P)/FAD-dependent oxidoreductase [Bdellovibrionales bacterium]